MNVKQGSLNSFLALAERLSVRGLTQSGGGGGGGGPGEASKSKTPVPTKLREEEQVEEVEEVKTVVKQEAGTEQIYQQEQTSTAVTHYEEEEGYDESYYEEAGQEYQYNTHQENSQHYAMKGEGLGLVLSLTENESLYFFSQWRVDCWLFWLTGINCCNKLVQPGLAAGSGRRSAQIGQAGQAVGLVSQALQGQQGGHCSLCGRDYVNIRQHIDDLHNPNKQPVNCTICGKRFASKNSMRVHKSTFHREPTLQ